ncbi:E3 ubiquitin-protein ligase rnf43 [Cladochytrium tenue]|nr:E3 ubiquitin-protein ligase rnf43 [Cladochytrium tenue]
MHCALRRDTPSLRTVIVYFQSFVKPFISFVAVIFISEYADPFAPIDAVRHLRGGLSKRELRSLPTFVYRPPAANAALPRTSDISVVCEGANDLGTLDDPMVWITATGQGTATIDDSIATPAGATATSGSLKAVRTALCVPLKVVRHAPSAGRSVGGYEMQQGWRGRGGGDGSPASSVAAASAAEAADVESARSHLATAGVTCAVCVCEYEAGERVRRLNCGHCFHASCVDPWLATPTQIPVVCAFLPADRNAHRTCPLCVQDAVGGRELRSGAEGVGENRRGRSPYPRLSQSPRSPQPPPPLPALPLRRVHSSVQAWTALLEEMSEEERPGTAAHARREEREARRAVRLAARAARRDARAETRRQRRWWQQQQRARRGAGLPGSSLGAGDGGGDGVVVVDEVGRDTGAPSRWL